MSESTSYLALDALEDAVPIIVAAFSGAQAGNVAGNGYDVFGLAAFTTSTLLLVWAGIVVIRWIIRWIGEPAR